MEFGVDLGMDFRLVLAFGRGTVINSLMMNIQIHIVDTLYQ
jgi:hypothetical protein